MFKKNKYIQIVFVTEMSHLQQKFAIMVTWVMLEILILKEV